MKAKTIFIVFLLLNGLLAYYYLPSLIIPTTIFIFSYICLLILKKILKKKLPNLFISITSVFVILSIIEILFLSFGFMSTWWEKNESGFNSNWKNSGSGTWYHTWTPNQDVLVQRPEFSYQKKTNSIGIIGEEFPLEKDSNEFRIIVLGDSFTEGVGTEMNTSCPKILERILNKHPQKEIKVLGAGVSGSDIIFCLPLLRDKLMKYQPDLVLSLINIGDLNSDIPIRGGMERFLPDTTVAFNEPPWFEKIFATSRLFRLGIHFLGYNENLLPNSNKAHQDLISDSVLKINESLISYNEFLAPDNIPFAIIYFPLSNEFESKENMAQLIHSKLQLQEHMFFINLHDTYRKHQIIDKDNYEEYFWPIDLHHNTKGYEKMATAIAIELKERNLIDIIENNTD